MSKKVFQQLKKTYFFLKPLGFFENRGLNFLKFREVILKNDQAFNNVLDIEEVLSIAVTLVFLNSVN